MGRFETERAFLKTDFEMLKGVKTGAASGVPQPEAEKPAEEGQLLITLPKPSKDVVTKANVFDCIGDRESVRKYVDEALTLEELSYLLWSTQGVRKITDAGRIMRTVPSAGGTNTFETYIFVRKVDGLAQGIYRYQPFEHRLVFLKAVEDMAALIDEMTMAERQPFVPYFAGKASVIFAWSTVPYRAEWKFDVQAHKKILIDVGHVCQNLYIAGESLDAGVCAIGIYNQNLMDQLLDLDGDEEMVIYLASAGRKAE